MIDVNPAKQGVDNPKGSVPTATLSDLQVEPKENDA